MTRGPSIGFNKHLTPSPELAAVLGDKPRARSTFVADLWAYIKERSLQDPADKRTIVADDKLRPILGDRCGMFQIAGKLNAHLKG